MTKAFQNLSIASKLPNTAVSIFSQMSALAEQHQALNLSQGFPNYAASSDLIALVDEYMCKGYNQYAPMPGVLSLRERIVEKVERLYGCALDPATEITITAGGTQALFTAMATLVRPGDEVIIFEPAYDSYAPTVRVFGGTVIPVRLEAPAFKIDWQQVRELMSDRTRLIIINNPNNPAAKMLDEADLKALEDLVHDFPVFLLSDEVYEHIVFDGLRHLSVLSYAGLRERSFVVASFGKLLHTTGWKLGYVLAPPAMMSEFRKIHQFNVFSVNTPMQMAVAEYLKDEDNYLYLPSFFQQKRDLLAQGLSSSGLKTLSSEGTYFLLVDYSGVSDLPELDFARYLTIEHGLATIPVSAFYSDTYDQKLVRLCFAKDDSTLNKAVEILNKL